MADARMPDEFLEVIEEMLPKEPIPSPCGGRPRVRNREVMKVLWYVLVTGCRWRDVPLELGCCGETARQRLQDWEQSGIWTKIHHLILKVLRHGNKLHAETAIVDSTQVRAVGGGEETGPSPVDRRKKGTKFTLMVDRQGVPLVLRCALANRRDHQEILPTVVAYPEVGGRPGRPKTHPDKLFADAGYDCEATRTVLRFLGIEPHIRKSKGKHGSHLGRIRWVVERTISWLKGLRRLRVRYDRLKELIHGWINLSAAAICFR